MRRNAKILSLGTFAGFLCLLIVLCKIGIANSSIVGSPEESQVGQFFGINENGDISISGTVVDELGTELTGIELELKKFTTTGFGRSNQQIDTLTVDGLFEINGKNISTVRLRFRKEGFYPVEMTFHPNDGKTTEGLRVVMQEIGELTRMARFAGYVKFAPSGSGTIIDVASGRCITRDVTDIYDASDSSSRGIYMESNVENGKIKMREILWGEFKQLRKIPEVVSLVMANDEDGFILTHYNQPGSGSSFREMKKAPQEGYVKSILLPPREHSYSFFCKIGDRYGKGWIKSVTKCTENEIACRIEILMQSEATGSQNVNTTY